MPTRSTQSTQASRASLRLIRLLSGTLSRVILRKVGPTLSSSKFQGCFFNIIVLIASSSLKGYDSRTNVFKMLTLINEWPNFSNHTYNRETGAGMMLYSNIYFLLSIISSPLVANSLEQIHDNIHDCVGGAGHMGNVAYAGSSLKSFGIIDIEF